MTHDPNDDTPDDEIPEYYTVHPDLLASANQTFDEREYLDALREIEATGGRTLESFIAEVEAAARGS